MYTQLQLRDSARPPVNVASLGRMKEQGEKISCITCYDASYAALVDAADIDVVLVGDSLGMVIQGHDTTVPVTLEHVIYHCRAVAKGLFRPFLMADMPFMTYTSKETALANAVKLMQEGGAKMVKLEGGAGQAEIVEFLASHDIAVCAHLGLRPQSVHKTGGFRVQGREEAAAEQMRRDAKLLQDSGADVVLLECVPAHLGKEITAELHVPVIGIGAGPDTDGQLLIVSDMVGQFQAFTPKFVKKYCNVAEVYVEAFKSYIREVKSGKFPEDEHCYHIIKGQEESFAEMLKKFQ